MNYCAPPSGLSEEHFVFPGRSRGAEFFGISVNFPRSLFNFSIAGHNPRKNEFFKIQKSFKTTGRGYAGSSWYEFEAWSV